MMANLTAKPVTLLGFDPGLKRIGVAVGESLTGHARPLVTLKAEAGAPDWAAVARLIAEWQPAALVVGVPRHADGSASTSTEIALKLTRRLAGRYGLPVHEVDECLSSHAAEAAGTMSRQSGGVDAAAAAVILETWLAQQTHS
jgi:putative Holliday junction resolvase